MSDCLFCKFVRKEIHTRVVFEDSSCLAFEDINPKAPVHILIVPKKSIPSISAVGPEDGPLIAEIVTVANELAKILRGKNITIARSLIGSYITSLEMAGCSITLLRLDDEMIRYWDAPVHTPALRWGW